MTFKQGPSAAWVDTGTVCSRAAGERTDRQEEIISFVSGMTRLLCPGESGDMAFIGDTGKGSYFSHIYGKIPLRFSESLRNVGT